MKRKEKPNILIDSDYLRYIIKTKKITTAEIAKEFGCGNASVNKKLNGNIRISVEEAYILMRMFNLTFEKIFRFIS